MKHCIFDWKRVRLVWRGVGFGLWRILFLQEFSLSNILLFIFKVDFYWLSVMYFNPFYLHLQFYWQLVFLTKREYLKTSDTLRVLNLQNPLLKTEIYHLMMKWFYILIRWQPWKMLSNKHFLLQLSSSSKNWRTHENKVTFEINRDVIAND